MKEYGQEVKTLTIQGGYRKYKEVAFLRGVAITTVVLMHLIQVYWHGGNIPNWLLYASSLGGTGGHVFIFCSGFGLYLSYLHRPLSFMQFMKKRFLKIYLPFLIFVIIHYHLPYWGIPEEVRRHQLMSNIFLYKMFYEKYICCFGLQLWFVSTIIELYLLFLPLCRLREKTSPMSFLCIGLAISAAWWIAMHLTGLEVKRIWGSFCLQYLWEFMLGMTVAEYLFRHDSVSVPIWKLILTAACGLGLQAMMTIQGGMIAAFNDVPALMGYSTAVLLLYRFGRYVFQPVFLWVDTISYEWFLVHVDAIMWGYFFARQATENEFLRALAATANSLVGAWGFSLLIRLLMKILRVDRAPADGQNV